MTKKASTFIPENSAASQLRKEKLSALLIEDKETSDPPIVKDEGASEIMETTVVGESAVVEGDLCTAGNLQILGMVRGDVQAGGNVIVSGCVEGCICGESISLDGCAVRGDVTARGEISVRCGTVVSGNLCADSAAVNGKVRGSVTAQEAVVLQNDAFVIGAVTGSTVTMQEGTALFGEVRVVSREQDKALAEDFEKILDSRIKAKDAKPHGAPA